MGALDGTIDIPKVGPVKKLYVYGAGGAVLAYVGYRYWSASRDATAAATGTPAAESTGTIGADIGSGAGGYYGTGSAASESDLTSADTATTNAQWTRLALSYLEGLGIDTATASGALAKYLDHDALTKDEQGYVQRALALAGPPPTGGPYTIRTAVDTAPAKLAAPSGVKATATSSSEVQLSWAAVPGAGNYRIFRSGASENVGASYDTTAKVGGLQPNTSYTFQVAAGAAGSEAVGPKSTAVTVKTKGVTLKAPTGLTVTPASTTASLKWTKVPGATGYNVYVNNIAHGHSDAPSYTVQGLKRKTKYSFKVNADTATGAPGPASATKTATTK